MPQMQIRFMSHSERLNDEAMPLHGVQRENAVECVLCVSLECFTH